VPTESPVFEGHFPGFPLMPGVLLIECMAQTTGWLVSVITGFVGLPLLVGVKEAKIKGIVPPGAELTFDGHIIHQGSGFAIAEAKGRLNGKSVCEARLTFSLTPYPNEAFRKIMIEMGHKVGIAVEEYTK
jgi:3-hydroxyacyl-[acyl-carrier-protein] dehydratase